MKNQVKKAAAVKSAKAKAVKAAKKPTKKGGCKS